MPSGSKNTPSRCTPVSDSGTHTFEIAGYSEKRDRGVGWFLRSDPFTVGGFDWAIRFYHNGVDAASKDYVVASLVLLSSIANVGVRVRYVQWLVSQTAQKIMIPFRTFGAVAGCAEVTGLFPSGNAYYPPYTLKNPVGVPRSLLKRPGNLGHYIVNDRLTIQFELTVTRESQLVESRAEYSIEVPPCDMMQHFGNLFKEKMGFDVTFLVGEETVEAHKVVLAARSPVFKAEFFGPMRESGACCVTVDDMQPEVFRGLLHFIYNDSLPDIGDLGGNEYGEMMWHLLAAADRYAMARMKLVCQRTICKNLDVETVATTLALADQHNCDSLKAACIEFIASPKHKDAVAGTHGYEDLKRACPSVFIDLFERSSKFARHK